MLYILLLLRCRLQACSCCCASSSPPADACSSSTLSSDAPPAARRKGRPCCPSSLRNKKRTEAIAETSPGAREKGSAAGVVQAERTPVLLVLSSRLSGKG